MRIALCQLHGAPCAAQENVATLATLTRTLAGTVDLLIVPELFLSGYHVGAARLHAHALVVPDSAACDAALAAGAPPASHPLLRLAQVAREGDVALCVSFAERVGDACFISVGVWECDGRLTALYRKVHLWGPYERSMFTPGPGPSLVHAGGLGGTAYEPFRLRRCEVPLGLLICFDLEFPEPARALALRGARILLCVAASGEAAGFTSVHVAPVRAAENSAALVWVNFPSSSPPPPPLDNEGGAIEVAYSGGSTAVGPDGVPLVAVPPFAAGAAAAPKPGACSGRWVDIAASEKATQAVARYADEHVHVVRIEVDAEEFVRHCTRNPYLHERQAHLFGVVGASGEK